MTRLYFWNAIIAPPLIQIYSDLGVPGILAEETIGARLNAYIGHAGTDDQAFDEAVVIFIQDDLLNLGMEQSAIDELLANIRINIAAAQPTPPVQDEAARRVAASIIEALGFDPTQTRNVSFDLRAEIESLKIAVDDIRSRADGIHKEQTSGIQIVNAFNSAPTITPTANPDEFRITWPSGSFLRHGSQMFELTTGTFTIPRPDAHVESLGITMAADSMTTFQSAQQWASFIVKANGVDAGANASYDDMTGVLTIPDPSVFPDGTDLVDGFAIGTVWTLDGYVSGTWTVSVVAIVDEISGTISYQAFVGSTRSPHISRRHIIGSRPPGMVQVASISNIAATDPIDLNNVNVFDRDRSDSLALIEAVDTHRHSGYPGDGRAIIQTTAIEAAEALPRHRIVARGIDGRAVIADYADPLRWDVIGMTIDSVESGALAIVLIEGMVEDPAWGWDIAGHRYISLGFAGELMQSSPVEYGKICHQVGTVRGAHKIYVQRRNRFIA